MRDIHDSRVIIVAPNAREAALIRQERKIHENSWWYVRSADMSGRGLYGISLQHRTILVSDRVRVTNELLHHLDRANALGACIIPVTT